MNGGLPKVQLRYEKSHDHFTQGQLLLKASKTNEIWRKKRNRTYVAERKTESQQNGTTRSHGVKKGTLT